MWWEKGGPGGELCGELCQATDLPGAAGGGRAGGGGGRGDQGHQAQVPGSLAGITSAPPRFIKLHVPMQVLKQYAEILKLRMTLKVCQS